MIRNRCQVGSQTGTLPKVSQIRLNPAFSMRNTRLEANGVVDSRSHVTRKVNMVTRAKPPPVPITLIV